MTRRALLPFTCLALALGGASCEVGTEEIAFGGPEVDLAGPSVTARAVDAVCLAPVQGLDPVAVEADYLPRVIACENGAASLEALKAQAVSARSYLYYKVDAYPGTPLEDGQGDQVYTCNNAPSAIHYEAVAATSGEVLMYGGAYVAGFYVAGAVPTAEGCAAVEGDDDYSDTEHYVTYNWGRRAEGVTQTPLGWVNPANLANRGCKSQNGADCLSDAGWDYEDILRYYYGTDVELVRAEGECVAPSFAPHGCGGLVDGTATVVDDADECFLIGCASEDALLEVNTGEGGAAVVTAAVEDAPDCVGRWRFSFATPGDHRVQVRLPDVAGLSASLTYRVRHAGMSTEVVVEPTGPGWVELGTFFFDEGRHQWIELADASAAAGDLDDGALVPWDAVAVGPPEAELPGDDWTPGTGDAGVTEEQPGPDAGEEEPDEQPDAGSEATGSEDDAELDAGAPPAQEPDPLPPSVQECACAAVPEAGPAWSALWLGLAAGALARRRSRSPRGEAGGPKT